MKESPAFINKEEIEYENLYTKGGSPVKAVRQSKIDKLREHRWDCAYITNDFKCSKCGTGIPFDADGDRVASEDVSHCWYCGAEIV